MIQLIQFIKKTRFRTKQDKEYLAKPGHRIFAKILEDNNGRVVVQFKNKDKAILHKTSIRSSRSNEMLDFLNSMRDN